MRGVVSLAVALALPLVRDDGSPFPFREELVFAAFVAIVTTLLVQGLSLGPLFASSVSPRKPMARRWCASAAHRSSLRNAS